jgi:5-formyltetrahydrofolate cyclo-ligase
MREPVVDGDGKAAVRESILARRAGRGDADRTATAAAIAAHLATAPFTRVPRVAVYLSMGTEPGTGPLIDALLARGIEVIVPVATTDSALDWVRYEAGAQLTRSALGVLEPDGPRLGADAIAEAGLVIVPALAVDQAGWRLGRGAGYFDRALAHARGPICALVYADELLPTLPHEPHDIPVDLAVTEAGIFRVPQPGD